MRGGIQRGDRLALMCICMVLTVLGATASAAAEQGFPLRESYPDVATISTLALSSSFDAVRIIDVRSEFEFDVIHIKGAANLPVAKSNFVKALRKEVRSKDAKVVLYCNGHTCAKSYKAAQAAQAAGFTKVYAYDAGIFEWASSFPEKAVLLNESPADTTKIIPQEQLDAHMLDAETFVARAKAKGGRVFDVREALQRKKSPDLGKKKVTQRHLDEMVRLLSTDGFMKKNQDTTLYFFDATGKQVRWLQYHLEKHGYSRYYFLRGGVWSIFGEDGAN